MNPLDLAAWCAALFLAANLFPHTVALRLTLLVLGLAFAALALARAKRPLDIRVLPPLLVPILLWAAWAAVSIKWSVEPERSMKEYKNEVAYVFLGYWLCWIAAQAPGARRAFGLALVPGATASCLIGLYVYAVPAASPWIERFANGPGDQSSALLTLMPLVLLAIWLTRKERCSLSAARRPCSVSTPASTSISPSFFRAITGRLPSPYRSPPVCRGTAPTGSAPPGCRTRRSDRPTRAAGCTG